MPSDPKKIATIAGKVADAQAQIVAANTVIQNAKTAVITHNLTAGMGAQLVSDLNTWAIACDALATDPIIATIAAKVVPTHNNNALPGEV